MLRTMLGVDGIGAGGPGGSILVRTAGSERSSGVQVQSRRGHVWAWLFVRVDQGPVVARKDWKPVERGRQLGSHSSRGKPARVVRISRSVLFHFAGWGSSGTGFVWSLMELKMISKCVWVIPAFRAQESPVDGECVPVFKLCVCVSKRGFVMVHRCCLSPCPEVFFSPCHVQECCHHAISRSVFDCVCAVFGSCCAGLVVSVVLLPHGRWGRQHA